ncbi:unnamed protein product [Arctogadus glacialis]
MRAAAEKDRARRHGVRAEDQIVKKIRSKLSRGSQEPAARGVNISRDNVRRGPRDAGAGPRQSLDWTGPASSEPLDRASLTRASGPCQPHQSLYWTGLPPSSLHLTGLPPQSLYSIGPASEPLDRAGLLRASAPGYILRDIV